MAVNGGVESLEEAWKRLETDWPCKATVRTDEIIETYNTWDQYDKDMATLGYHAADALVSYVSKLDLPKDSLFLDVGCGTGIVGVGLQKEGFTNIHGQDGSESILKSAEQKGVYKDLSCCIVGNGLYFPVKDDTYDVVVTAGGLSPGHFLLDAVIDMFRILKPGGYFAHVCRDVHVTTSHADFSVYLQKEHEKGNLIILTNEVFGDYYKNTVDSSIPGRVQVVRKANKSVCNGN